MKTVNVLSAVLFVSLASVALVAQDPVKVESTHYKLMFENPSVRVLKIDYAAGSKSAMHQHPDAIVVALDAAKVRFGSADGKSVDSDMANDSALYTPATTHTVTNMGTARVQSVLVEFKTAAPGTATLPASRPGMTLNVLAQGPRAIAYKTTAAPTFSEPAGTTHDFDQVVIALGPAQMSLAIAGKPAKTSWARGDAEFVGRGVAHEAKNTGGKPVDMVIVAIK
jgi:quercetin dioxygenase-like cupin family protein